MRLLYGSRRVSHLKYSVICSSEVLQRSDHHASCRLDFQGQRQFFRLCNCESGTARDECTGAIIVLMKRIFVRQLGLFASTAVYLGCGADSATKPTGGFAGQVDIRYLSDITPALQAAVTTATAKWTRALSKNLGDFPINLPANSCFVGQPPINETHHNLLLFVSVADIDGPGAALALTSVCRLLGARRVSTK